MRRLAPLFASFVVPLLMGIGPMQPSSSITLWDAALGRVPGTISVHKFGRNNDIDTAATEHIWRAGGNLTFLTTAVTMEVISGDANDATAGTGCQEVTIYGLDQDWNLAEESMRTAGLSASTATTTTFIRLYRAVCSEVGAYGGANDGVLTIRVSSAGSTQLYIAAGEAQTEGTHYAVPAGYTAYGIDIHLSVASGKTASVEFKYRTEADNTTDFQAVRDIVNFVGVTGGADYAYWGMQAFPEKTDIWAVGTAAANGTDITVDYMLLLVRNNR